MCGIFGFLGKTNNISLEELEYCANTGKCRGPDNTTTVINTDSFLIFHRLSINGLNSGSDQPLRIGDITLLCNGEIYNSDELWRSFDKSLKCTDSDCEIIIHLFERYGIEYTLNVLDGEFAIVLIDDRVQDRNVCHVARDPMGVRPLYQSLDKDSIMFGSILNQLIWAHSSYENISHFEPGTYSTYINDTIGGWNKHISSRYNSLSSICPTSVCDSIDTQIRLMFTNAVIKRVSNTQRPVACLLSGGLDSSIVAALSSKHYSQGKLETYSIGMPGGTDLKYARMVANHIGSQHREVVCSPAMFLGAIPEVISKIGSFDVTTVRASVGNYLVAKYIFENSDAKVILNGDGSDELMGGYLYFLNAPCELDFDKECRRLLADIHMFDCLRSDRCISSNGLEARTPFLDRSWVQFYLGLPSKIRFTPECEKGLFRNAWKDTGILPADALFRRKEAFSDGVSSAETTWYTLLNDQIMNLGFSSEEEYYKQIFEQKFGKWNTDKILPYKWMPKWCNATDPSARTWN